MCWFKYSTWHARVCVPVCIQKLEEADIILFPINISNVHWCLAAVYPKEKRIRFVCVFINVDNGSCPGSRSQTNMFKNNCRFTRGRLHPSQKPQSVQANRHTMPCTCRYFDSLGGRNGLCLDTLQVHERGKTLVCIPLRGDACDSTFFFCIQKNVLSQASPLRGDACDSTFFRVPRDEFLRGVIIAFHSPHCFSLALCLSALHVSARVTDGIMMMVQLYMQDQGEVRGINDWAGEWQKEHANPPQVWSCACVWVMVVVV